MTFDLAFFSCNGQIKTCSCFDVSQINLNSTHTHNSHESKLDMNVHLAVMEAQRARVLLTTDTHQKPPFC